jgi:transketolase
MALKKTTNPKTLALHANQIRQDIIRSLYAAGTGHPGGSLGMTDIFTVLYFSVLNHDPKRPLWKDRDRVVLSNGHICPVLYATLARTGYFPVEELMTLRKFGSRLQGHPHRGALPGLETTSGPLGSGLSQAVGMALAARQDRGKQTVYALTSDGEHEEGNHWEAVMLAAKYKLRNLVQVIDRNYIQIDGRTEDVMPLESLVDKYRAFHWEVIDINGNSIPAIQKAFAKAKRATGPVVIHARTIPGKGVRFMEDRFEWHGKTPDVAQTEAALAELTKIERRLAAR